LDFGIPTSISRWLLEYAHQWLSSIRDESIEKLNKSRGSTTANAAMIPAFLNGTIGARMPNHNRWV